MKRLAMKFAPLDVVFLKTDLPDVGLLKGQIGVIIDTYHCPSLAYEVEFCDDDGKTIALLALPPDKLSKDLP